MFDIPFDLVHSRLSESVETGVKSFFHHREVTELENYLLLDEVQQKTYTFKYISRREPDGFLGVYSDGIYDQNGTYLGDSISYTDNVNDVAHISSRPIRDDPLLKRPYENIFCYENNQPGATHGMGQQISAFYHGFEVLPRNVCAPKVTMESVTTQMIVHKAQKMKLAPSTMKILTRSNYKAPFSLKYDQYHDDFVNSFDIHHRSTHVLTSIFYISLSRLEYPMAWNALCALVRGKSDDIRFLWRPALELLSWYHSSGNNLTQEISQSQMTSQARLRGADYLLNWIIMNFQHSPVLTIERLKPRPRAKDLVPFDISMKIAQGEYKRALDVAIPTLLSRMYSSNPLIWALAGLASLKVNGTSSKTKKYFKQCMKLGGVIPEITQKQAELDPAENEEESSSEDSQEESEIDVENLADIRRTQEYSELGDREGDMDTILGGPSDIEDEYGYHLSDAEQDDDDDVDDIDDDYSSKKYKRRNTVKDNNLDDVLSIDNNKLKDNLIFESKTQTSKPVAIEGKETGIYDNKEADYSSSASSNSDSDSDSDSGISNNSNSAYLTQHPVKRASSSQKTAKIQKVEDGPFSQPLSQLGAEMGSDSDDYY